MERGTPSVINTTFLILVEGVELEDDGVNVCPILEWKDDYFNYINRNLLSLEEK